jgi:methylated-DNA-[protein]-cysteine S-methyltransferase
MNKHFATSTTLFETPCGYLLLGAESGRLCKCSWLRESVPTSITNDVDGQLLNEACRQLQEYFAHERREFQLPLSMSGTLFQKSAWEAMLTIPYGQIISYAEEARRAGHPTALRAIGNANGRNPLAIIVPCHRVIAADGSLCGFAGKPEGEMIEKKRRLLESERLSL